MDFNHISRTLGSLKQEHFVPGAQLAVHHEGRTWHCEVGVAEHGSGPAIDADRKFPVGSITKAHTATLAMLLVSDGDLELDAPLGHYLPELDRVARDLGTRLTLSFAEAALGTATKLVLPDEREVMVKVDPGCQPGSVVVVKGEGAPRLDRGGRGDLHVMVSVQVPKKLSKNAKRLLQELEHELKTDA